MNEPTVPLPPPIRDDFHKGDFGRVALIGGSRGMAGSIALSSIAAVRSGSGLVSAIVPDEILDTVAGFHPSLMTVGMTTDGTPDIGDKDAVGIGPGLGTAADARRWVHAVADDPDRPRVFDADALNIIAAGGGLDGFGGRWQKSVLTPHPGELQRLTDVDRNDRERQIAAAMELARKFGTIVVVKGGPTVVVNGTDRWTCSTGGPAMATGGSGDVLTGIITSLLGQGMTPWDAARLAVDRHGAAGDAAAERLGIRGVTASDIAMAIRIEQS